MNINEPYLLIDVNDKYFTFLIFKYNENFEFQVIDFKHVESEGVNDGKIVDVFLSSQLIRKSLNQIEKKNKLIFKYATVISNQHNFECINITGFKKINGSQILSEDITYVLNDIKQTVLNNKKNKSLIHLFNTSFNLDKKKINNLPIGLYGEFYTHHLTLFLLPQNDLKNLKLIFNKCDLNIERVVLKPFVSSISHLKNTDDGTIAIINIGKKNSTINVFYKNSFLYFETFTFGSDIVMKDVSKICLLDIDVVESMFNEIIFDKYIKEKNSDYLGENFFKDSSYRKISISHLQKIIEARIEEIIDLIYKKNANIFSIIKDIKQIKIIFEDINFQNNLKENFKTKFPEDKEINCCLITDKDHLNPSLSTAELIFNGWEKEAIPIIQTKKSIISRIFTYIFS